MLERLRSLDNDTGRAASAYLDLVGCRLLDGFDISGRYALELPDALIRAIRASVDRGPDESGDDDRVADVRGKVPADKQGQFDEMLEEARLMYRIRDERGVFSDIWASGIMRRAVLGGGRRLADRGRIHDPEHFVDAGFDEMRSLLTDGDGPSADELAERHETRTSLSAKDAPGDPRPAAASPAGSRPACPPRPRGSWPAVGFAIDALFGSSEEEHEEDMLRGLAASGGVYDGPARRVAGPDEFDRIIQGDVLVTESTTEAFNILLPLLGAIVTDSGGLLSHSAIVAREYGIPGVVGTREATDRIADGALGARGRRRRRSDGARVKEVVPLEKARDDSVFGSKAVGLGEAARGGLPLPPGVALSGSIVEAVASGEEKAIKKVAKCVRPLPTPLAVRSSAVDEDGAEASFAGQHLTLLNVLTPDDVTRRAAGDLVVGELRLGDHIPAASRPVPHAPASASSSSRCSIPRSRA